MDFFDVLLAKKLENDQDPTIEGLSVTENGRYEEEGKVYKPVIVNVPQTTIEALNVSANGEYTAPSGKAYSPVNVNVPLPQNAYLKKSVSGLPQPIASFSDGADEVLSDLVVDIEPVQSGSGAPSPTNVRPISGWTEANVTVNGANLLDSEASVYYNYTINEDGTINTSSANARYCTDYILSDEGVTYYVSGDKIGVSTYSFTFVELAYYDESKNYLGRTAQTDTNTLTATTPSGTKYFRFGEYSGTFTGTMTPSYIATYNRQLLSEHNTYTIPFTDSQGNPVEVYGGSVDVVNGTSGNVNTHICYTFDGSEDWGKYGSGSASAFAMRVVISDLIKLPVTEYTIVSNYLKSLLSTDTWGNYANFISMSAQINNYIICGIDSITTVEDWKTYLSNHPLQVRCELATPTTFYTQPTAVKSLDGVNNIFADTGDVTECEYFSRTE